jgi:hypothetical protein
MGHLVRLGRKPSVLALLAAAVVVAGIGLALFQPWKLWVDTTVDEAAPPGPPVSSGTPARPAPARRDRGCRRPAAPAR